MANQATEDPGLCTIVIAGYELTGFADGVGYQSSFDVERFNHIVGNRGLSARYKTISASATISLNILSTSADNDILTTIFTADNASPGGALVPLAKVTSNARIVEFGAVYIAKLPDTQQGGPAYPIIWPIRSMNFTKYVGGYEETPIYTSMDALKELIANAPPVRAPV
jgi:hypothetical protein